MSILNVNAGLSGSMTQSLNTISSINRLANDSIARINSGLKYNHVSDAPGTILKAQGLQDDISGNSKAIDANNYTLGQFDGVLEAQDQIASILGSMSSLKTQYDNESDTSAKATLAEEYKAYAVSIDTLAKGASYKDQAVLDGSAPGTTSVTEQAFAGTGSSVSLGFTAMTLAGLGLAAGGDITTDTTTVLSTAQETVSKNNASISTYRKLFEGANSIMSNSNTGYSQSYNELIKVNDAEESALLTSLSNQASAANAALSYQSKFYNISSGSSFTA